MTEEFEKAVKLGLKTVENGGEISRAEETVKRICIACGASDVHVFIIPSLISVTVDYKGKEFTTTRRIYKSDLNLGILEETNNISRALCNEKSINKKIDYHYNTIFSIICVLLSTGSFCIYFGGTVKDAVFSGIAGVLITYIPYKRNSFNDFSKTLIESTFSGIISYLPSATGIATHPDKIMIGTIMLLIPGMSIGSAMKDMMSGNPIAGLLQLSQAIITTFAIAFGFALATLIFGSEYLA